MIKIKRKLYSDSSSERDQTRLFANVRKFKKAMKSMYEGYKSGKKPDLDNYNSTFQRIAKMKGIGSPKTYDNPNFDKVASGAYTSVKKYVGPGRKVVDKSTFVDTFKDMFKQDIGLL